MKHYLTDLRSKLATAEKCPSMMRGGIGQIPHRKKNNKGFTLVELIVVIVILAILAAILIPGLLKWIDKAKEEQYTLEARNIYLATQSEVAVEYAKGPASMPTEAAAEVDGKVPDGKLSLDNIANLSDVEVKTVEVTYVDSALGDYDIKTLTTTFNSGNKGITATMTGNGSWNITVGSKIS